MVYLPAYYRYKYTNCFICQVISFKNYRLLKHLNRLKCISGNNSNIRRDAPYLIISLSKRVKRNYWCFSCLKFQTRILVSKSQPIWEKLYSQPLWEKLYSQPIWEKLYSLDNFRFFFNYLCSICSTFY